LAPPLGAAIIVLGAKITNVWVCLKTSAWIITYIIDTWRIEEKHQLYIAGAFLLLWLWGIFNV
jgi:hypothetical protein